jgi:hypothetical protein
MRFISLCLCLATLALAGCAQTNMAGMNGALGGGSSRPKTVVVSDFLVAADVPAIDRGFSTRQESKGGYFPILERRQRTLERVNDEIIAAIVAGLRDAGLNAEPGSAEGVSLKDGALVVSGRLHGPEQGKHVPVTEIGFGPGRGRFAADMTLSSAGFGKKKLLNFVIESPVGRKAPAGKAAADNEAIASVLAAEDAAPEKLSPDVEGQARRLGDAVAGRIIAYAKEQGWLAKPEGAEAAPEEKPQSKRPAKKKSEKQPTS